MSAEDLTVLVVDDDPTNLELLAKQLSRSKRVLSAPDAKTALELLGSQPVDVLISDVEMPEMSGHELVMEVKARHPDVVRIMLTAYASLDSALRAINQGEVFRYLTKPWRSAELSELMTAVEERVREVRRARAKDREKQLAGLEARFPGVSAGLPGAGEYAVDPARVEAFVKAVPDEIAHLLEP